MSFKLSKQYLSFRSLAAAMLLSLASPMTGLTNVSLWAAPPSSVELAEFRESDLIQILDTGRPVEMKYQNTDTSVTLDQAFLKNTFKFYLDSKKHVRQMIGTQPTINDPRVVSLSINAGAKKAMASYVDEAGPAGSPYSFQIVRPDGSYDSVVIWVPNGASQADVEKLMRDALLAKGYTIGENGVILLDGKPINQNLSDLIGFVYGGAPGGNMNPGGGFYTFNPGAGNGQWNFNGGGAGGPQGGSGTFNFGGSFGVDQSGYLGGANGMVFFKLANINKAFHSDPYDIIDNSKMNKDWINYEFKLGNLTYKLEKMSIPGLGNDEWVILRKGEGDIWYLIKQDEHAALMEILKNSSDPSLKSALSKIDGFPRYLDKWDQADYDNVRKHAMKYQRDSWNPMGGGFGFSSVNPGSQTGGSGGGFYLGGMGNGGMANLPSTINSDIYTFVQGRPNASLQDIQSMLDQKYGPGMVVVSQGPNGSYQFQIKGTGPDGSNQLSNIMIVQAPSNFNFGSMMPGSGGGQFTVIGGGSGSGGGSFQNSDADDVIKAMQAAAAARMARFGKSNSSSGSSSSGSGSGSRSDSGGGSGSSSSPNGSSSSSSSSVVINNAELPSLEQTASGEWRLTIPIPVDSNKDGKADYYDYSFIYIPQDKVKDGKIDESYLAVIQQQLKDAGVNLGKVSTIITTAPGESKESQVKLTIKSVQELFDKAKGRAIKVNGLNGYFLDEKGTREDFSMNIPEKDFQSPEVQNLLEPKQN